MTIAESDDLPRANVRRVVKNKLVELTKDMTEKKEISLHKEAVLAFAESAKIFIHYLSATANDLCRESKRQTVNADDVLKAVEEIDFPEFVEPLKFSLEEFRKDNAIKKLEAKEKVQVKKRKADGEAEENGESGKALIEETNHVPEETNDVHIEGEEASKDVNMQDVLSS